MKTFIGILLFGLLGFLGCSGSDDGTNATVGQATAVAPFGIVETPTPTFEWTPVRWATKYRLVVQETSQESTIQDTSETYVIDEWYTAEEAGCASEDGLCEVMPDAEVIGKNEFKILACANEECGSWSAPMNFDFTAMSLARFTDNGDGTVTDNHTNLMWSKNAKLYIEFQNWHDAIISCEKLTLAGHTDWRLPFVYELSSLIDKKQKYPALPPGNPFLNNEQVCWTSSTYAFDHTKAWVVTTIDGIVVLGIKAYACNVWPVRSH